MHHIDRIIIKKFPLGFFNNPYDLQNYIGSFLNYSYDVRFRRVENLILRITDLVTDIQVYIEIVTTNLRFLLIFPLILVIWFLGRFLKFLIKRSPSIPPDARNGIFLFIGILQIYFIGFGFAYIFQIGPEFILGLSTIFATAIGFASTSVAANIVGGFYIILTRPFGVGDFISTQGKEGIVQEIGLNFTKMMQIDKTIVTIPNSNLLNASLENYTLNLAEELKKRETKSEFKIKEYSIAIPESITKSIYDTFEQDEVVRHSSMIQLKLNATDPSIPLSFAKKKIMEVCDEFKEVFGYPIRFYFGRHVFRQDTFFVITTSNPYTIFNYYPLFLEKIVKKVFMDLQEAK